MINVAVSSTAAGVSVSGGTAVLISVPSSTAFALSVGSGLGPAGVQGPQGPQGPPSTTITVGKVETLSPGANATVTSSSSNSGANLTLNFGLPAGQTGATGAAGTTPSFSIGKVSTLAAGSSANVTLTTANSGANVTLDFGIPAGADGSGSVSLSNATPSNLGTASAGSSNLASRADHTHSLPSLVSSVNNLTGSLTLAAGSNVTLTANGSTLTLSSSAGGLGENDAVDGGFYAGSPVITITTQPTNQTASSGSATFTAAASVSPSGTPTYQWQKSDDAGTTWANVSGATSATLSLSSLTNAADDGDRYRVVVSATGATSVTSTAATLTVSSGGGVAAGALFGWGYNAGYGQIGDGTTTNRLSPVQIGSAQWSAVACGGGHTLAISNSGLLHAWGNNSSGHLGDGTTDARLSPVQIGSQSWSKVAAGASTSFAIRSDGKLFGWGNNRIAGAVGVGTSENEYLSPAQIGNDNWTLVTAAYEHAAAIRADGKLFAWGANQFGQIGDGTTTDRNTPTQIGTDSWTAVDVGYTNTAAIRSDGKLFVWGSNGFGQIADGTTTQRNTPTQVGTDSWIAVACGEGNVFAIRADGKLFAWGKNSASLGAVGQLGDGTTTDRNTPTQIGTDNWSAVSTSFRTTLAIRSDGKLFGWGDNATGTVGDGTTTNRLSPVQIGSANWASIAVGNYTSFGIVS